MVETLHDAFRGRRLRAGTFLALAPVLLSVAATGEQSPGTEPVTIRILAYNIRHGEGTDGHLNLARVAEVIRAARPDLVALQEVDQGTKRAGDVDQLDELATLLDMHGEFGVAMGFEKGRYGVGVLSRWPLKAPRNWRLPSSGHREPRTALTVLVRAGEGGPLLQFTSTHFDQSRESLDQMLQARFLNHVLASVDSPPSVLAGDFNARPGTEVMAVLDARWINPLAAQATEEYVSRNGRRRGPRGDYVLFRPAHEWRVIEARTLDDRTASDHRPVLTVLEWTGAG